MHLSFGEAGRGQNLYSSHFCYVFIFSDPLIPQRGTLRTTLNYLVVLTPLLWRGRERSKFILFPKLSSAPTYSDPLNPLYFKIKLTVFLFLTPLRQLAEGRWATKKRPPFRQPFKIYKILNFIILLPVLNRQIHAGAFRGRA